MPPRGLATIIALKGRPRANGGITAPGGGGGGNPQGNGGNGNRGNGNGGGGNKNPGAGNPQKTKPPYGNGPPGNKNPGGGNGGKQGGGKFNPWKVLRGIESNEVLSPEQMAQFARALSGLETRPEVHGYQRLATELGNEKELEAKGLEGLGNRTSGQVSSVYGNIAKSAAQSIATQNALSGSLASQSANIASQGTQELGKIQEGALGTYEQQLQMRGAEGTAGTAQSQLASAVAAQQAQQQTDSQAAQQGAIQQGQGYSGLLAAEAQAAQNQGGETIGQIGRTIGSRTIKSNREYDEGIKTALQKKTEAKASQGEKAVKDYLGLLEGNQKQILGKAAVSQKKNELSLAEQKAEQEAAEGKTKTEIELAKLHNETRDSLASWQNAQTNKYEAEHPNAGKSEVAKHEHELTHDTNEVLSLVHQAVTQIGHIPGSMKEISELTSYINGSASAAPQVVAKVIKTWWNHQLKSQHTSRHSGGNSGNLTVPGYQPKTPEAE